MSETNAGRTTLILSLLLLAPYYFELPLVVIQRILTPATSVNPAGSMSWTLAILEIAGSFTVRAAFLVAIVTLFRRRVSWGRKGVVWLAILLALLVHALAWKFSPVRP